jgi:hypothetical protein
MTAILSASLGRVDRPDETLRSVTRTHFVELVDSRYQVAVPMFADWIRDQNGS